MESRPAIRLLCCICKQGIAREIGQDLEGPAGYSFEQGENMKIAMVGSGYVGLVSGACFADFGHDVVCIDKDQSKIDRLNDGIMPIYEPGLADLVTSNAKAGRLTFTASLAEGIKGANAIFIAVGTPSRRGDGILPSIISDGAITSHFISA